MATTTQPETSRPSARVHVQRFGTFLSNMIMPNIGAIIAWGLLTAFVIPDGWTPNEQIATVVGPTIFYLLPILIAYTGGKLVYGVRGGVVGAVGVMGVILATSDVLFIGEDGNAAPMFLGAMVMGPLTAWTMKKIDAIWDGKVKPGFEMLIDNFSAGIWAAVMSIGGMFLLAPVLREVIAWLGSAVQFLVDNSLLPLSSILIEPAKALFLCVGVLYDRLHTRDISAYGGVVNTMPVFAFFAVLFGMANAGLPGTSGFVGEFLVIIAAFKANFWYAFVAALTLILGAAYTLWLVKRVIWGDVGNDGVASLKDLNWREFAVLSVLAAAVIALGVWPAPLLDAMRPTLAFLVEQLMASKL